MVVTDNPEYEHFKHVEEIQSWIKTQPNLPQNIRKTKNNESFYYFLFFMI